MQLPITTSTGLAASYISVAEFQLMVMGDYDLSSYSTPQLQDLLNRASGQANGIMKRSLLAQERIETFYGTGSNVMPLNARPILYVRQMQFVQPGIVGFIIPTNRVLVDYVKGEIVQYSPLELQGVGFVSVFPAGLPIAITYGRGYGYNPCTPPAWTSSDSPTTTDGLAPGWYTLAITTKNMWGETLPTYQSVQTATGSINCLVTPVLGAWKYRVFGAAGAMAATTAALAVGTTSVPITNATGASWSVGQTIVIDPMGASPDTVTITAIAGQTLTTTPMAAAHSSGVPVAPQCALINEIPSTTFGGEPTQQTISTLVPISGYYPENAPLADSSQLAVPQEIRDATRLLALSILYEQNNLANRGIATTSSGRKRTQWRSTEGASGRGVPTLYEQATAALAGKKVSGPF